MPANRTTLERVRAAVTMNSALMTDEIGLDTRLYDLDADSLEMQSFILDLEDLLGIDIPEDETKKFFTVRDIVTYADSRSPTR
jgi:acyl carrier protein